MTIAPKRVYLAQRHPSLAKDDFKRRWRQHGRLAMSFMARADWANVARYVHCDPVPAGELLPGISDAYDGVGMIWFRSQEARERHRSFKEGRLALHADEKECFAQPVDQTGCFFSETVMVDGPTDGVKRVRFLKRSDETDSDRFYEQWCGAYASKVAVAFSGRLRRHVHNIPLFPNSGGLDCDGIEETWFQTVEDLVDWTRDTNVLKAESELRIFIQEPIALVTEEIVLYSEDHTNSTTDV